MLHEDDRPANLLWNHETRRGTVIERSVIWSEALQKSSSKGQESGGNIVLEDTKAAAENEEPQVAPDWTNQKTADRWSASSGPSHQTLDGFTNREICSELSGDRPYPSQSFGIRHSAFTALSSSTQHLALGRYLFGPRSPDEASLIASSLRCLGHETDLTEAVTQWMACQARS